MKMANPVALVALVALVGLAAAQVCIADQMAAGAHGKGAADAGRRGCVWQRETLPFDFAWRHHLGDVGASTPCPANAFPVNLSGVECMGLNSDSTVAAIGVAAPPGRVPAVLTLPPPIRRATRPRTTAETLAAPIPPATSGNGPSRSLAPCRHAHRAFPLF
jgi:hypothetical protein